MFKKLLYVLIVILVMVFGLVFVLENQTLVTVSWQGEKSWGFSQERPLSVIVVVSFVLGVLLGWIFSLWSNLRLRGKLYSSNRKLKQVSTN